jgi:Carbohydrate family 9 binding domain-like
LPTRPAEVIARRLSQPVSAFPDRAEWNRAEPVSFCHDWQAENSDPHRHTEVALLWNEDSLYVHFLCSYREVNVFADADSSGRRDELWDRDVAEIFLQADRFGEKYYKEFEVSPNGQWLDLDITPEGLRHIESGLRSKVQINKAARVWTAELAIPMASVTANFDPAKPWRVNFFRCEGVEPERFYSCWQPTETLEPNFHVPQKFGWLRFEP